MGALSCFSFSVTLMLSSTLRNIWLVASVLNDLDLELKIDVNITVASNGRACAPRRVPNPQQELHAFCAFYACYIQSTGLWVTQHQSTIYKICISVGQTML